MALLLRSRVLKSGVVGGVAARSMFTAWWGHVEPAPKDTILGVTEAFLADPSPNKVNVGVMNKSDYKSGKSAKRKFTGTRISYTCNISGYKTCLEEYRSNACSKRTPNALTVKPKSDEKWKPPDSGTLRLDVDVCYDEERRRNEIGGIIRASDGLGVFAFGQSIPKPISVVEGGKVAIQDGLSYRKLRNDIILLYKFSHGSFWRCKQSPTQPII